MKLSIRNIRLIYTGDFLCINPIKAFNDINGNPVYAGDRVEFYLPDSVYPTNGIVRLYPLRVEYYSQLLDKWKSYEIA